MELLATWSHEGCGHAAARHPWSCCEACARGKGGAIRLAGCCSRVNVRQRGQAERTGRQAGRQAGPAGERQRWYHCPWRGCESNGDSEQVHKGTELPLALAHGRPRPFRQNWHVSLFYTHFIMYRYRPKPNVCGNTVLKEERRRSALTFQVRKRVAVILREHLPDDFLPPPPIQTSLPLSEFDQGNLVGNFLSQEWCPLVCLRVLFLWFVPRLIFIYI